MTALYELTAELKEAQSLIAAGELTPEEMSDTLEGMVGEFNDKAIRVVYFQKNLDASIDAIDSELSRLNAKKKQLVSHKERMTDYLRSNMQAAEISKIECPLFSITLRKPSKVVAIDSQEDLPEEFVTVKTTTAPNKKAIGDALKAGQLVPGAHLEDGRSALMIK